MENAMLYFFSAIFQGFAALLTLGVMFYLYYQNKTNERKMWIESELRRQFNPSKQVLNEIEMKTVVEYCRENYVKRLDLENASNWDIFVKTKVDEYDRIMKKKVNIERQINPLLSLTIVILIYSMLSLLIIGYSSPSKIPLIIMGLMAIIVSVIVLSMITRLINKIIKN